MICPHCRNESIVPLCPHCGWERKRSLRWAAEESETQGKWARAAVYWRDLSESEPGEPESRRRWARCIVMGTLAGIPESSWESAEGAVGAVVREQPEWDEGHQLRIRLWEKFGKGSQLEEIYRSEGLERWAHLVGLVQKFKEDHSWKQRDRGAWGMKAGDWFLPLVAGVLWVVGWLVARGATEGGVLLTLFTSLTLMTAGLMFLLVFVWALRKKIPTASAEEKAFRGKTGIPDFDTAREETKSDITPDKNP